MSEIKNEFQYGKEGKFDEGAYVAEQDPERRLEMAKAYFDQAENAWIYVYSTLANQLNQKGTEVDELVTAGVKNSRERQRANGGNGFTPEAVKKKLESYPQSIRAIIELQDNISLMLQLGDAIPLHTKERYIESSWNIFLLSFGIAENRSSATNQTLEWFKNKILTGEVLLLALAKATDENQEKVLDAMIKQASLAIGLSGFSQRQPGKKDYLILVADLMNPNQTGQDLISQLAHENGHETRNDIEGKETETEQEVVFSEFFSFMEEWRSQSAMTEDELDYLSSRDEYRQVRAIKELLSDPKYSTNIPQLGGDISVHIGNALDALNVAFHHGLETAQRRSKTKKSAELLKVDTDIDIDTIKRELDKIKLMSEPVGNADTLPWSDNLPSWLKKRSANG